MKDLYRVRAADRLVCNAFTLNRLATEALQLGRIDQAVRYAAAAVEACAALQAAVEAGEPFGPPLDR